MFQPSPATEKQAAYIRRLLDERELTASPAFFDATNAMDAGELAAYVEHLKVCANTVTMARASQWIESLLALPKISGPGSDQLPGQAQLPKLEDGRYAVEHEGVLKFYRLKQPTEGRWAGYTFLEVQASDELHPVRNRATKAEVLALIQANPLEALRRYGQELGSCGHCGRTLTDETSRAYGIGPVCRGKLGIYSKGDRAQARIQAF